MAPANYAYFAPKWGHENGNDNERKIRWPSGNYGIKPRMWWKEKNYFSSCTCMQFSNPMNCNLRGHRVARSIAVAITRAQRLFAKIPNWTVALQNYTSFILGYIFQHFTDRIYFYYLCLRACVSELKNVGNSKFDQ